MNILRLGDYSGVHCTLAEGLRSLGHHVVVASNGDFWKDFPRDIDLARNGKRGFLWRVIKALPHTQGFDIVQLRNHMFMEMKAERLFHIYNYLRKHNGRIVLSVVGDDYYFSAINKRGKPDRKSTRR